MLGHFCHSCALFPVPGVNGLRMLGIIHDTVVFLIEQLYGAKHCHNYKFRFHKPEEANEPPLNPHGSARAEVHLRQVWALHLFRLTRTQAGNLESAESSQFISKSKQLSPVNQLYCIFFVCTFCCVSLFNKTFLAGAFIHSSQKLSCVILMHKKLWKRTDWGRCKTVNMPSCSANQMFALILVSNTDFLC